MGRHLSYANVMATIAVFVALGGTTYAAASLGAGSVGTRQLQNGAVTAVKVRRHTLTGRQIRSSTLGTVPNALSLGGAPASAWQRQVTSSCTSAEAIESIATTGAATCVPVRVTDFLSRTNLIPGGTTEYGPVSGISGAGGSDTVTEISPAAAVLASSLEVSAGPKVTVTLQVNGASSGLTCTTGATSSTCASTGFATIPAGATLDFMIANNGGVTINPLITWQGTST